LSYYKDGKQLFAYNAGATPNWDLVAATLWDRFDPGMKRIWYEYYGWGE